MKTDIFDFVLPEECIAQHPVFPRDSSRLLVVQPNNMQDRKIKDLLDYLSDGDVIIFNDTKVIPARLFGKKGDAKIEVTLFKRLDQGQTERWECLVKNSKRLKQNSEIIFSDDFSAEVIEKKETGEVILDFKVNASVFMERVASVGNIPLPPYIRKGVSDEKDKQDYQTVYAKEKGAIAAPTAGLHFTPELLEQIKAKGIKQGFLTLHVGGGTFLPVKVDDTDEHVMHAEYGTISQDAADIINSAKANGKKIIAVGTTSLRLLESAADADGKLRKFSDYTDIFITPGYKFKIADVLMTNFHLPKSTLFMLVSAFSGLDEMQKAYSFAIDNKYRFYSYGDSSLLFKKE